MSSMSQELQALLRRILQKDDSALLLIYDQFGGLVFSIAYQVMGDRQAAEEITQDVFMKVWQKVDQYDASQSSFTTWLGRIARNTAIDAVRKASRRPHGENNFPIDDYAFTLAARNSTDPGRTIALHSAIKSLPADQAELINLAYFGGMSHNDIAEFTGLPLGTVKSRLRSAMQRLREIFNPNPEETA